MTDNTPFFIVGAGRSGTTLLRLILAGHSRLHIPPETRFVHTLVHELPLTGALTVDEVQRAVEIITEDVRWPDMEFPADEFRFLAASLPNATLVNIINLVYHRQLAARGKQRFGDKTPLYIEIVPQLATLYPGAKFIHLIRDGRDVAISRIDLNWERYYERDEFEWTRAIERRRQYRNTPYASKILDVRYESFIADLRGTVQRICEFLGEQFEAGMLHWQCRTALVPERERHIHGKLNQPVSSDAVAVWRRKLSSFECFAMEACLHDDLQELGYELRFSAAAWQPLLTITGRGLYAAAPLLGRIARHVRRHGWLRRTVYF